VVSPAWSRFLDGWVHGTASEGPWIVAVACVRTVGPVLGDRPWSPVAAPAIRRSIG